MLSPSGRYVMVFNGEIYNHLLLREQINYEGIGTSDTETVLAKFGQSCQVRLKPLEGMSQ